MNAALAAVTADLQRGVVLHQAGALDEAESAYRAVLRRAPRQPDALHLLGVIHHQRGDSRKAVDLIRRALKIDAGNANAMVNLGAALQALGQDQQAEATYRRAIERLPGNAEALANLAAIRQSRGDNAEAIELLRRAVALTPGRAAWRLRLATLLLDEERFEEAAAEFAAYLAQVPDDVMAGNNYGVALEKLGRFDEAIERFRRMVIAHPDLAEGHANLGNALAAVNRIEEAETCYRQAVALAPENWKYRISLANFLIETGRVDAGMALYQPALAERQDDAVLRNELGARLVRARRLNEAVELFRAALAIDPDFASAYNNLGNALTDLQRWEEALPAFRESIRLDPASVLPRINICQLLQKMQLWDEAVVQAYGLRMSKNYTPEACDGRILQVFRDTCDFDGIESMSGYWHTAQNLPRGELASVALNLLAMADDREKLISLVGMLRDVGRRICAGAAALTLPPLAPHPPVDGRKLRIGFLSSDLRTHSVAKFMLPLFRHYDRERFEVHCYSGYPEINDPVQLEIRGLVDGFRFVDLLNDREAAQAIRDDRIDILFDLGGFTAHSRVTVLSFRAAPIQATWLGWPATTGIEEIDLFVVDRYTRPTCDDYLVETPLELSGAFCCFESFKPEPLAAPPFLTNGYITFGTLNGAYKFTRRMLARWAEVMHQVPNSRMVIVRPEASSMAFLDNIVREFARNGIERERLDIIDNRRGVATHLSYYNLFDISLDTYPVTGGTTTTDALWMGVPVVTLVGPAYHQRISGAIARHCGLDDLCVDSEEDFVRVAVGLANDRDRLVALRQSLRPALLDSPLCRVDKFMAGFQDAVLEAARKKFG